MDEAVWIAASKSGDVEAFNLLVIAHQQAAYELAFRMLRDEQAACDATQDAFLAAFTRIHQFRGGSFRAWLLRIVLNHVYDHLRALRRHPTESLDTLADDEETPVLQIADDRPTPEQVVLSHEVLAIIGSGLDTLPPEQRATVILSDVQGMSYEEVAAATGASLGTVKSRLSRGRSALRGYLAQHAELLPPSVRQYFEGHESRGKTPSLATDG